MATRCKLWRYRARTLRGRAAILRSIVLPLLWYTAAVTRVPADVAQRVKFLCKAFLFKKAISDSHGFAGPMVEAWLYWPTSRGGLGLPETLSFSHSLQLCSLQDASRWLQQLIRSHAGFFRRSLYFLDLFSVVGLVSIFSMHQYPEVSLSKNPGTAWLLSGSNLFASCIHWCRNTVPCATLIG
ncbi:uncharacterized protein CCR75_008536 [Bremia lactucae]|uniref:Uncharacterized protein n=1 Tax=Bremia lactucae TaxID=4779 RepID=A0A976FQE6_BRELC|nr:hypothetical protein CCR75_008536 [Bremia lactucae]